MSAPRYKYRRLTKKGPKLPFVVCDVKDWKSCDSRVLVAKGMATGTDAHYTRQHLRWALGRPFADISVSRCYTHDQVILVHISSAADPRGLGVRYPADLSRAPLEAKLLILQYA